MLLMFGNILKALEIIKDLKGRGNEQDDETVFYTNLFLHKKHGLARRDVVMAKPLPGWK